MSPGGVKIDKNVAKRDQDGSKMRQEGSKMRQERANEAPMTAQGRPNAPPRRSKGSPEAPKIVENRCQNLVKIDDQFRTRFLSMFPLFFCC